jgi:hypothetical protein
MSSTKRLTSEYSHYPPLTAPEQARFDMVEAPLRPRKTGRHLCPSRRGGRTVGAAAALERLPAKRAFGSGAEQEAGGRSGQECLTNSVSGEDPGPTEPPTRLVTSDWQRTIGLTWPGTATLEVLSGFWGVAVFE